MSVVVLAWQDEPWLERAVTSALASEGVAADVVLVDNGCTTDAVERLAQRPGVTVVRPGRNLGFAGGCDAGAAVATGTFLALLNSDAEVAPDALRRLADAAAEPGVGIATASVRLADDPSLVNSAGNPLHVLGLSWAGGLGEPAAAHARRTDVACASGAGLVLRRSLWEELGGFAPEYFAYLEDAELSWRCWQRGLRVVHVPDAVVVHRYEFSRNPQKSYLLERNRLLLLLTAHEARTLALLAVPLLALELAMTALAVAQGWGRHKARGWWWLLRHAGWVRQRRARLQAERTRRDRELADLLTTRLSTTAVPLPVGTGALSALLAAWWAVVRRLL
ncbi:MAG TPA: glycosyltransferase [Mycobacteriales bacterium]|nr:glycosyltransferase [Mycobacteriales bacterium]